MKKSKALTEEKEDANQIFHQKIEILKKRIEPYKEYNWENLIEIAKHAIGVFGREGIVDNIYGITQFANLLDQYAIRPHFKIRKNKTLPFFDSFINAYTKVYYATYHWEEVTAAKKKHEDAMAATQKKQEIK